MKVLTLQGSCGSLLFAYSCMFRHFGCHAHRPSLMIIPTNFEISLCN